MPPLTLPPVPRGVRTLKTIETERLREQHPDLPKSLSNCVTCRGAKSFRWLDDAGEPTEYTCDCEGQFILHRYLLHSGVGLHYQRLRWDDATGVTEDVLEVVGDYTQNCHSYVASGVGLLLHGKYGTGKTMLSSLLIKSVLARGVPSYFTTFHRMLDSFTEGWEKSEAKRLFDTQIRNAGLLVIDDIGREHQGRNAVAESVLDSVLRSRIENARSTIITTNRTPADLGTLYSGNALSMISECMIVHEFTGTDYRPEQNKRLVWEAKNRLVRPVTVD